MKKILLLICTLASITLSACAVHTPAGSIVVDPDGRYHDRGTGDFCPPGQAKKGRC
ncbi:hypothetical protein [Acinetobacter chinensis]|uniref:hypothetical protein n=1 Tax=Acinetobacter chinensis TaxID=2004650 RepID=UPI000B3CBC13|nr:hypothetical protein [Acinetobacter chinensis]